MQYRTFQNSEEKLSLLGFGAMRLPLLPGGGHRDVDRGAVGRMVDYAMEHGVNYFDTAYPYHEGQSELVMGEALQKHPRDRFYLADKMPVWLLDSVDDARRIFDEQLKKCRVDYFDFYLVHSYSAELAETVEPMGVYEMLDEKRREGKIRHLGVSIHDSLENMKAILSLHGWDFVQLQINYMDWALLRSKEQYEYATSLGIPVIVMEPVRGGALAQPGEEARALLKTVDPNATPASLALRFAASLENAATVLSGMSDFSQLKENVETMSAFSPVSAREQEIMERSALLYRKAGAIPCTACAYCMDCPFGVDIPRLISLYNEYKKTGVAAAFDASYQTMARENQAHNCASCGACEGLCPQKLEISKWMREIADYAKTLGYE